MDNLQLNPIQQQVHDHIIDWFKSDGNLLTLGGYAGTGKTTLIGVTIDDLKQNKAIRVAFCAYTGKASTVLKSKLRMMSDDYCGTIHGLIYEMVGKFAGKPIFERRDHIDYDLIVIDEASMIDSQIFNDLQSYGIPILAVGDHGQLPPINGKLNLMENPDIKLEQIMRQEEGNPIVRLATMARVSGDIPIGDYGQNVRKIVGMNYLRDFIVPDVIILAAMNKTRVNINHFMRSTLDLKDAPKQGEPVICLRNNRFAGIYNGNISNLISIKISGKYYSIETDLPYSGTVLKEQFGSKYTCNVEGVDLFDWAYCITTHKAQGSEFDNVILIEERMSQMDDDNWRRWLYTGVTRARKCLTIIKK